MKQRTGLDAGRIQRLLRRIRNWRLCLEASAEAGIAHDDIRHAMRLFEERLPAVWLDEGMRWHLWEQSLRTAGVSDARIRSARQAYVDRLDLLQDVDWEAEARAFAQAEHIEEDGRCSV